MNKPWKACIALLSTLLLTSNAFGGHECDYEARKPVVMIMVDNSSNWHSPLDGRTRKARTHEVLHRVLRALQTPENPNSRLDLGLMAFQENSSDPGARVLYAARDWNQDFKGQLLTDLYDGHAPHFDITDQYGEPDISEQEYALLDAHASLPDAAQAPIALAFDEFRRYMKGEAPRIDVEAAEGFDVSALDPHNPGKYLSPLQPCANAHLLYIANGAPSISENQLAENLLNDLLGEQTLDGIKPVRYPYEKTWGPEYAQTIHKYCVGPEKSENHAFVDLLNMMDEQNPTDIALAPFMESIPMQGGGKLFNRHNATEWPKKLMTILGPCPHLSAPE